MDGETVVEKHSLINTVPYFLDLFFARRMIKCDVKSQHYYTFTNGGSINAGIRWKFQNLRVSTLTVDFGRISSIMSMLTLLRRAPQIEQLHIEVDRQETMGEEISEAILDAGMPDDSVKTLKRVMLTFAKCFPSEMFFVKLLLAKATSLESLQVMLYWESMMPSPEACIQFAMYKNDAASKAKFEVHGGMGTFNIVS
uniref:FBD domain-containing protein n=1 Tax=Oryza brachyantha TaxID=4533 RepID=J3MRQ0_ORYBR